MERLAKYSMVIGATTLTILVPFLHTPESFHQIIIDAGHTFSVFLMGIGIGISMVMTNQ